MIMKKAFSEHGGVVNEPSYVYTVERSTSLRSVLRFTESTTGFVSSNFNPAMKAFS